MKRSTVIDVCLPDFQVIWLVHFSSDKYFFYFQKLVMGGGVKGFNLKWLQNSVEIKTPTGEVELIRVDRWVEPHKTNSMKAYCQACHKSFDIKEGWWAVKRHGEGTKHNAMFKSSDYNQNKVVP